LKVIAQRELGQLDLRPTLRADIEVVLSDLRPEILKELAQLQPTGQGNPPAIFVTRNVRVTRSRAVGKDNAHLKLTVTDGRLTFDAIAFRQGGWLAQMPPSVDLLFVFEVNEYNGRSELQLNVRDLKPAGTPD
jgi:single-stranded-DNA-specific exonuclease